jgi:hypothetical protein
MPFTRPAIYFRDISSTSVITPDPSDLPSDQILQFDSEINIVELVDNAYQNNVSVDPATNPDGSKKTFLQDNGRLEDIVTVSGKLNTDSTFINKLKSFSRKLQIEAAFHKVGIFGLAYPVTDSFDLDPTDEVGYFIDKLQISHRGQAKNIVSFTLTLKTGGDLV